ncbi:MAG TPA: TfoX/Sxy family protein [Bryobacteraceae bacterium]|nr:TfoX/Sxy family protein [Bryobacteraceae bacterium]
MPNRASYMEFLLEQLSPLGDITARSMFGGHVIYCQGIVFALVANNALYLKADDHNRPAFEARGLEAFHPFEDANAVMQYYEAPPELFEDPRALLDWAGGAVAAGRRAQSNKKSRQPRKPGFRKKPRMLG